MSDHAITIDLSAPARLADVPQLAHAFFRWWTGELVALLPARLKALIPTTQHPAVLHARNGTWRIIAGADNEHSIDLDTAGTDSEIAEQILHLAPGFAIARVVVVLPRESVLTRRIELPLIPDAQVRDAVALQVDRLSPFKADDVCVAARIAARHLIEGKLEADVVFARRSRLEQIESRLQALGLTVVAVDIEDADGNPAGFNLRPKVVSGRRNLILHVGLTAGAALAWVLASYAWTVAREGEIESWRERVASLRPVAERTANLRRQVEGMIQPFQIARDFEPARTLAILTELTDVLPDDARLTELRLVGGDIELTGLATNAPGLIGKLESSKRLAQVKFKAPVTRWQGTAQDRFEITAKLEGVK